MKEVEIPECDTYKLCSVWHITEWRDGCVYKTEFIGHAMREGVEVGDYGGTDMRNVTLSSFCEDREKFVMRHPNNRFVPKDEMWKYYNVRCLERKEIEEMIKREER